MNNVLFSFQKTRDHYLSNADETISKRELRKASELLWGGVTQSIKLLAATKNIAIHSHTEFRIFVRTISAEIKEIVAEDYFTFTVYSNHVCSGGLFVCCLANPRLSYS